MVAVDFLIDGTEWTSGALEYPCCGAWVFVSHVLFQRDALYTGVRTLCAPVLLLTSVAHLFHRKEMTQTLD